MTALEEARNVSRLTDVNLAMEMNANATKPGRIAFWHHLILILSNLYEGLKSLEDGDCNEMNRNQSNYVYTARRTGGVASEAFQEDPHVPAKIFALCRL